MPSGYLTPRTTFSLNGVAYETLLGGSPDDPLIRLLARGAAGYRTAARAVQYALQQPLISVSSRHRSAGSTWQLVATITGHYRNSGEACEIPVTLTLTMEQRQLASAAIAVAEGDLQRIAAARRA